MKIYTAINEFKNSLKVNESNDNIDWELQNHTSSLKFIYPPKPDSLTKKFLDFIYQNPGSTKAEFYNHINRQLTPGNNAHFFAGIKDAGLVELVGNKYYIGQNYGKWTQNKLSTNPSKAPSYYDKIRKFNESKGTIHGFTLDDLKLLGFKSKEDFKEKLTKAAKEDQKINKLPLSVCKEDNIKVYHDELKSIKKKQNINESLVKVINVTEEDLDIFKSHTGLNCVIEDGMIVYEEGLDMFALVKHSDGTFILMKYNDTLDEYEELPGLYDVRLNKIS